MKYFIYDNKSTESFDLIITSFEKSDVLQSGLTREIIKGETNQYRARANHFGTKYTETITFKISLMNSDFSPISRTEINEINKWLTSPKYPKDLYTVSCKGVGYRYKGLFTEVSYEYSAEGVMAINYTFVNDSPFVYSFKTIERIDITKEAGRTETILCNNCCAYDYIYPTIKLTRNRESGDNESNEDETTKNKFRVAIVVYKPDSETEEVSYLTIPIEVGNTITIDCKNQILTDEQNTTSIEALADKANDKKQISWIKFIDGENVLSFKFCEDTGDEFDTVSIEINWEEPEKVGELFEY